MEKIPKIKAVQPLGKRDYLSLFRAELRKSMIVSSLLSRPHFHLLASPAFFNAVHVDPGGYGISWSDDIDLSEYELWRNGKAAPNKSLKTDVAKSRHAA